jgi:hypothetical protein
MIARQKLQLPIRDIDGGSRRRQLAQLPKLAMVPHDLHFEIIYHDLESLCALALRAFNRSGSALRCRHLGLSRGEIPCSAALT